MRILLLLLILGGRSLAVEGLPETVQPQSFVIGITPFLENGVKDDLYRTVVRLIVQDLPLNSDLAVYDAFNLKSITRLHVPNSRAFASPKTRANQFASSIRELKQFLAQDYPRPVRTGLKFEGALRVPQFCDFLAENLPDTNRPLVVMLIGSPLYQDEKEPDFSMVDGYFPSDGHLQASREKSIFGLNPESDHRRSMVVHWVYFGDPWVSELHQERVTRFWSLYLERRGAELASFCGDLPTVVRGFGQGAELARAQARHWLVDPGQTKVEMLRVGREVETVDWIQRDVIRESAQSPPSVMVGPMKIGIRWKHNIDLDLYATPRPKAETLFFQHLRSPEGFYYKDHRSSPGREYEFIEFDSPVDAREVEAFVNFYQGSCPGGPPGEVRIEFDGRIYSAPFAIAAANGNRGRAGDSQADFWTRLPIQQILKLSRSNGVE